MSNLVNEASEDVYRQLASHMLFMWCDILGFFMQLLAEKDYITWWMLPSTPNMTGWRFHRIVEMIPALPWWFKSAFVSTPTKKNTKQGDARGTSEVRRGTSSNISIVWCSGRPVKSVPDSCWQHKFLRHRWAHDLGSQSQSHEKKIPDLPWAAPTANTNHITWCPRLEKVPDQLQGFRDPRAPKTLKKKKRKNSSPGPDPKFLIDKKNTKTIHWENPKVHFFDYFSALSQCILGCFPEGQRHTN